MNNMIRHEFDVENYWKVIVYYNVDYNFFSSIIKDFKKYGITKGYEEIFTDLYKGRAKAVTISNLEKYVSIVLFNKHSYKSDFLNSIVHEAEHVKQAMLKVYLVEDKGEPPAYTIGYLVMRMIYG